MADMNIEQARHNMIEQQIRPWDVLDQRVLEQMQRTPREDFVLRAYRNAAFTDTMLPIGHDQRMLEPKFEARLLQALAIQPDEKALEVGTGSGYMTALLAGMASEVVSVEIVPELHEEAKARLARHGVDNAVLEQGDASNGWDPQQPYDVIAVTGSLPVLAKGLIQNLQIGGRLFAVVGQEPAMKAMLVTRLSSNDWREDTLFETVIPPLMSSQKVQNFTF